jgi:hypothetical protein
MSSYILEKALPHFEQVYGLSFVCDRLCRWRCSRRLKDAPHSSQHTLLDAAGETGAADRRGSLTEPGEA